MYNGLFIDFINNQGGMNLEAGVRNKLVGEIEAIKSDEIMAEIKMRGT
jgi:hypothetical protein